MTNTLDLLRLLLSRLEKISADSVWAHRASGVRGSLIRALEEIEANRSISSADVNRLIDLGFYILKKAAEAKAR